MIDLCHRIVGYTAIGEEAGRRFLAEITADTFITGTDLRFAGIWQILVLAHDTFRRVVVVLPKNAVRL